MKATLDNTRAPRAPRVFRTLLGLLGLLGLVMIGVVAILMARNAFGVGNEPRSATRATAPDTPASPTATSSDGARTGDTTTIPAAGPGVDESREQIAKGHSRERRQVRLRFGCETLRHNVTRVWRHMRLRARIADTHDQYLAECTRPERATVVSLPRDVMQIAISAPGYRRTVVPTPPTLRPGVGPTIILLEPDALVRVRARNLPAAQGSRFTCGARLATGVDDGGRPILRGRVPHRRPDQEGTWVWEFKIPSGVPVVFDVARTAVPPGARRGFLGLESPVLTLAPGEQREITLDLQETATLAGRVTGAAPLALEGQVVSVEILEDARTAHATLDRDGQFRIMGLDNTDQEVALRLRIQAGRSPALQEVGTGRRRWRVRDAGFLVLEPEVPVYGVVPARGGVVLDQPFQVQTGSAPRDHGTLARKIPLFTRQKLERGPLFFLVAGIGHFQRNLAGRLPDGDGLYRVEVPAPGGSLDVRVENQPPKGMSLFAKLEGGSGGIPGSNTGTNWHFEGLSPGDYRLLLTYDVEVARGSLAHTGRLLPRRVAVQSGVETKVTVRMPAVLEIPGQVTNWRDIETSMAPDGLRLHHGEHPHRARIDAHGAFQLAVLGPWDGAREVTFEGPRLLVEVKTTDVTWLGDRKRLLVTFPGARQRRLLAHPVAGGRLGARVYPAAGHGGRRLSPREGCFRIPDLPGGVDGILWEQVHRGGRQLRILQGWFRLAPGGPTETRLAFKGRLVQVSMAGARQAATLTLKPPAWWRHPLPAWAALRLEGTAPRQLWLPDDAAAVVVDGGREIPRDEVGPELVIDKPGRAR